MKIYRKYLFLLLILFGSTRFWRAQNQNLKYYFNGHLGDKTLTQAEARSNEILPDKAIAKTLTQLQNMGHLLARVDSVKEMAGGTEVYIHEGPVFEWAYLKPGNLNAALASKVGLAEQSQSGKVVHCKQLAASFEKLLRFYENTGYPFATVGFDSVQVEGNRLSAVLRVEKNKYFTIDSILIKGSLKLNKGFVEQYYGIKEGMPYQEDVLNTLSQKTKQLPFITEKQEQRVQLTKKTNKLLLFYDKKDASQFDGIIGFLPDAATKKTIVTGDVKLKLVNGILHSGETFDVEWRRLKSQTQDFNGRITYPYLFKSPIGVDYNLKIYRRDTTFIDINSNIALQYYFKGLNYVKLFYKQRNTNLISTNGYALANSLPDYADIQTQAYGIGVLYEQYDYKLNPRKGLGINISGQAGNRNIKKNPKINTQAYDQVLLRSSQYQVEGQVQAYLPLHKNHVLKVAAQGASVFGNTTVYRNELFRIGGLKTLRGFDEESIFCSTYLISTVEYRFLYARTSNLFVFTDAAWYENLSTHRYTKDQPLALGAGISFDTKAGILNMSYALGNQMGNGFDVRNGKIHFGLVALF